ncbi:MULTISPECIES: transcription antiterminator [Listeria]|uniref:BglG family transcription antiterminator n=1 Tax=Listeria TaxID=1637 RepID=UPI000B589AB0|nr:MULTISPECIES: transcription antiterminator [Listeria]
MYLSARSRIILEKILPEKGDISIQQLANDLDVSERTVRRDLDEVKQTLESFGLSLIRKGSKLSVSGSLHDREHVRSTLLDLIGNEFTPLERQQFILRVLLTTNEPVKLIALASELSVTVATVGSDLTKIEEEWDGKIRIERKRGIGVHLDASVIEKRELLRELLLMTMPKLKLYQYFVDTLDGVPTQNNDEFLSHFIDFQLLELADRTLTRWMKKLSYEVDNDSLVDLLIYLLITVKQISKGKIISKKSDNHIFLQDYPEYDIAERILKDCLPEQTIPEAEITELTMQVLEAEIRHGEDVFYRNEKVQAIRIAKKLISRVAREIELPLSQMSLLKGLTEHIQYSLIRLKKKMPLSNPLLPLIKSEFGDLFNIVQRVASELYPFKKLPEEETGFIVLHFEAAIIQSENLRPYSALIVTSRSNGVSTWLRARFRKRLPKLQKIKFVTPLELVKETDLHKYDIVLSTTDLTDFKMDYERISIFISDAEIKELKHKLEKIVGAKGNYVDFPSLQDNSKKLPETLASLKNMHQFYGLIISFLESLYIEQGSDMTRNKEDNLRSFSQSIANKEPDLSPEKIFKKLSSLEAKQKVISGGANSAYFLVNDNVKTASTHVFTLKHSLDFQIEDGLKSAISTVMIFMLPYELNAELLEITTYLLTVLTEDDAAILLAESGDKEKIASLFSTYLEEFLEHKNTYRTENLGFPF